MAVIRKEAPEPDTYRDMMRKAAPKSEAEIAEKVVAWLQDEGWDCYPEVAYGKLLPHKERGSLTGISLGERVCDVVAVKDGLVMMVECKKSWSLDLIEQALEWTKVAPLVVTAVPANAINNRNLLKDHLRDYFGLGLCGVWSGSGVMWHRNPRLLRHNLRHVPMLTSVLSESMKVATAGGQFTYRRTPYQDTIQQIRCLLAEHGPMPLRDVFARLETDHQHHYSSPASLRSSVSRSIHTKIEPDLVFAEDGLLTWQPELCTKGQKYIDHITGWAATRRDLAEKQVR